jgi:hypothetical protein
LCLFSGWLLTPPVLDHQLQGRDVQVGEQDVAPAQEAVHPNHVQGGYQGLQIDIICLGILTLYTGIGARSLRTTTQGRSLPPPS